MAIPRHLNALSFRLFPHVLQSHLFNQVGSTGITTAKIKAKMIAAWLRVGLARFEIFYLEEVFAYKIML